VLNFRRQNEEQREFELAEARRVMQQEEERLVFFQDRQEHYQKELLERQKEGISPAEVALYNSYVEFVKQKIVWQMEAVEVAIKQVEKKKEELLAARKDRKTLERLRSRRYDAFLTDSKMKEMKHLDEIALGKHHARTRERRDEN
jgi:flagellar FliJ protein